MPVIESQAAANYTDNGSPEEHCSICAFWRARGTGERGMCQIVTGTISPDGWCRHFDHQAEAA
jgi:hypothetical protein